VDDRVASNFASLSQKHNQTRLDWEARLSEYVGKYPVLGDQLERSLAGRLPDDFLSKFAPLVAPLLADNKPVATRVASGKVINAVSSVMPELIGGSADLAPSNKTFIDGAGAMSTLYPQSRNIHFGVREHSMGAILNGLALHGGLVPFGGTFLVFSDFLRPAVRLSALMSLKVIYVLTHDSVGVGEDGPTHQPVEHFAALRSIPNLRVYRPADGYETASAWAEALAHQGPTALLLSRQNLPLLDPQRYPSVSEGPKRGGYILSEASGGEPEGIIIATGSEVHLALEAQSVLRGQRAVRVVSLPCWEVFQSQDKSYIEDVIPKKITKRLAVEAGRSFGWERWVGDSGHILSIDTFGYSAPASVIFEKLGFTPQNIADLVMKLF
jgi:transketolase